MSRHLHIAIHEHARANAAVHRDQVERLRRHDRRSYAYGLHDPEEENLLPDVIDPEEENLLPDVIDPDDLRVGQGGHSGGCGCSCNCAAQSVGTVYAPICATEGKGGQQPDHMPERCYSGFVIVRLAPGFSLEGQDTLDELAKQLDLSGLLDLLRIDDSPPPPIEESPVPEAEGEPPADRFVPSWPLIRNTCHVVCQGSGTTTFEVRDKLAEMAQQAKPQQLVNLGLSLLRYWRIDLRQYPERIPELVKGLQALPVIERAYREVRAEDSGADNGEPMFSEDQSYLDDAPVGIGAKWAKALSKELGLEEKVRCCDIEQRWVTDHKEFAERLTSPVASGDLPFFGDNRYAHGENGDHGTAVVAQMVGEDRIEGISKETIDYEIASHYDRETRSNGNIAEAVINVLALWLVLNELEAPHGNVILIEAQRCGLVAEIDPADFAAISLATGLGVLVVEAAGNTSFDLDTYEDERGRLTLRRGSSDFRDSGAVVVGAAWSALPHDRARFSNYGSRVDCYGWGDNVVSAGYGDYDPGDGQPSSWYTSSFSGTSSAAPMIAGAAAWLQYLARNAADNARALDPRDVRALLADRATGTPQGPNVGGNIGVMPNLCAILQEASLGIPQIYLRRTIADNGWDCREVTCSSPDIVVAQGTDLDSAQDAVEKLDAHQPVPGLSPIPDQTGQTQQNVYVFCRPRNRGLGSATRKVRFYTSEPATLIRPDMWEYIGESGSAKIEHGGQTILGPVTWESAAQGYYALLAVLGPKAEPSPPNTSDPLAKLRCNWWAYRDFLGRADVGCRNTHWIRAEELAPNIKGAGWETAPFSFSFTGAPDRLRTFDFEIVQRLPAGAQVHLTVPLSLAAKLRQSQPWRVTWPRNSKTPIMLPANPRIAFRRIRLAAGADCKATLSVAGGKAKVERGWHSVAVRQLYRGEEVGRVTWYLH